MDGDLLLLGFLEFRKVCGHTMSEEDNPTQNVCLHEDNRTALCTVWDCPYFVTEVAQRSFPRREKT